MCGLVHGDTMTEYDAFLILGGGLRPDGLLPPWARRRLEAALALHRNEYLIYLSAGTVHKPPPLRDDGFPIIEAMVGARYLIEHGVPAEYVLPEACSYDTIGNAFFSRVVHVDPRGFRRLLVITSDFHMPRTEAIFRWVYGFPPVRCRLDFVAVPDEGIDSEALVARRRKEWDGLQQVVRVRERVTTLADFHRWLFTEHLAYAPVEMGTTPGAMSPAMALDTY